MSLCPYLISDSNEFSFGNEFEGLGGSRLGSESTRTQLGVIVRIFNLFSHYTMGIFQFDSFRFWRRFWKIRLDSGEMRGGKYGFGKGRGLSGKKMMKRQRLGVRGCGDVDSSTRRV